MTHYSLRNLYVSNLPPSMTNHELQEMFLSFGATNATVMFDAQTGTSKGYGFVGFNTEQEGMQAMSQMHGKPTKTKRNETVVFHITPSKHRGRETKKHIPAIFVRNIKEGIPIEALHEYFRKFGSVTRIIIRRDVKSPGMVQLYVEFETVDQAQAAIDATHGIALYPSICSMAAMAKFASATAARENGFQQRPMEGFTGDVLQYQQFATQNSPLTPSGQTPPPFPPTTAILGGAAVGSGFRSGAASRTSSDLSSSHRKDQPPSPTEGSPTVSTLPPSIVHYPTFVANASRSESLSEPASPMFQQQFMSPPQQQQPVFVLVNQQQNPSQPQPQTVYMAMNQQQSQFPITQQVAATPQVQYVQIQNTSSIVPSQGGYYIPADHQYQHQPQKLNPPYHSSSSQPHQHTQLGTSSSSSGYFTSFPSTQHCQLPAVVPGHGQSTGFQSHHGGFGLSLDQKPQGQHQNS